MKLSRAQSPSQGKTDSGIEDQGRRSFLEKLGFGGVLLGLFGIGYQSIRSLIPNILYEPPKKFKIGLPTELAEGVTFIEEKHLYVFREGKSFFAISGTCTHLGCTVKYAKLNQPKSVKIGGAMKTVPYEFHCPCHGSKFYADGTNYAGPAPKPLAWYSLHLSPDDGQLAVNMNEEVAQNFRLTV